MGQNPFGRCWVKKATAISPQRIIATGRVSSPTHEQEAQNCLDRAGGPEQTVCGHGVPGKPAEELLNSVLPQEKSSHEPQQGQTNGPGPVEQF